MAAADFLFELDESMTTSDSVAWFITLPTGVRLHLWSELDLRGDTVVLRQVSLYGIDGSFVHVGYRLLRQRIDAAMQVFDVRAIRIEAMRRTSGAHPGRDLGTIAFRRRGAPSSAASD